MKMNTMGLKRLIHAILTESEKESDDVKKADIVPLSSHPKFSPLEFPDWENVHEADIDWEAVAGELIRQSPGDDEKLDDLDNDFEAYLAKLKADKDAGVDFIDDPFIDDSGQYHEGKSYARVGIEYDTHKGEINCKSHPVVGIIFVSFFIPQNFYPDVGDYPFNDLGYREGGSYTHDGIEYDLDKSLEVADLKQIQLFKTADMAWVLQYVMPDPDRVETADLNAPILVAKDRQGRLTVIDGLHRLSKAIKLGVLTLPGRFLTKSDLKTAERYE